MLLWCKNCNTVHVSFMGVFYRHKQAQIRLPFSNLGNANSATPNIFVLLSVKNEPKLGFYSHVLATQTWQHQIVSAIHTIVLLSL